MDMHRVGPETIERRYLGLFVRKKRWGLSGRGLLVLAVVSGLAVWGLVTGIHPFLAVTKRVDARILVVEGWVNEYAIKAGAEEFMRGKYERVYCTGGPVTGTGGYTSDYMTSAHVGAGQLAQAGVPAASVHAVPSRIAKRDRTYSAALALRDRIQNYEPSVRSLNIVTENVHARRTRILFQKALGKDWNVGIIAVPHPDYDEKHWWRYSEGVRDVLGESIAYVYARFFFHPSETD